MSMGRFSVRFKQLQRESTAAMYSVESPDFNPHCSWEEVAQIRINLKNRYYIFYPGELWRLERTIPLKLHEPSSVERDGDFGKIWAPIDAGHGYFSRRLHLFARYCIDFYNLPSFYPIAHFLR